LSISIEHTPTALEQSQRKRDTHVRFSKSGSKADEPCILSDSRSIFNWRRAKFPKTQQHSDNRSNREPLRLETAHHAPIRARGAKDIQSLNRVQAPKKTPPARDIAVVSAKGARRWQQGHPWIYKSDLTQRPTAEPGAVAVHDHRGKPIGTALWSPSSEISLRFVDHDAHAPLDHHWWRDRIGDAIARRQPLRDAANAYRLIHGEGDACPSLICDRYDRWLVVQLMSAGLEAFRPTIVDVLDELASPDGILARNDVPLRAKENLPVGVELLAGNVPDEIEVNEHGIKFIAAPRLGQKTGAFLDQRENRVLIGDRARGRALDCFSYHGSFALHLARRAESVVALDVSAAALARAGENCALNGITNVELVEADTFDYLRDQWNAGNRFDTIVLDPPAFAKTRASLPAAIRGYKDINLRALRLLARNGILFTASCSFHLTKPLFLDMLRDAAADSGRRVVIRAITGQPLDHPEIVTIPETGYLKGALLEVTD
jgi:23S rRNA (cytosine1962-C5)-methyltransferase